MGKFIYIVFIIGWVIYNLYKAANKNKPVAESKPGKNKIDQIKELMERTLQDYSPSDMKPAMPFPQYNTSGKAEQEIIDKASSDNKEKNKKQPKEFKTPSFEAFETLYLNDDAKIKTDDVSMMQETNEPTGKINLKDFDITQAVIYSEILKRPLWLN